MIIDFENWRIEPRRGVRDFQNYVIPTGFDLIIQFSIIIPFLRNY